MPKNLFVDPQETLAPGKITFKSIPVNAYNKTIHAAIVYDVQEPGGGRYRNDACGVFRLCVRRQGYALYPQFVLCDWEMDIPNRRARRLRQGQEKGRV